MFCLRMSQKAPIENMLHAVCKVVKQINNTSISFRGTKLINNSFISFHGTILSYERYSKVYFFAHKKRRKRKKLL